MPSTSEEWKNLLNGLGDKPTYTSKYQNQIDGILDKITNREQFSYDFNADPLFQQYKDNFTKLGNEASMNAVANASAMTGGFGSSYATTAAAQANQQYLNQMNDMIPELYNAALSKYRMESEDLLNKYSVTSDAENRNYSQYRDNVADYYTNRDYYTNGYNNALGFEYQKERDAIADAQYAANMAYQKDRDNVSDAQWNQSFDYNKQRAAVSDEQWQKQYELSKSNAAQSAANAAASLAFQKQKYEDEKNSKYSHAYEANAEDFNHVKEFTDIFNRQKSQEAAVRYLQRRYEANEISEAQLIQLLDMIGAEHN